MKGEQKAATSTNEQVLAAFVERYGRLPRRLKRQQMKGGGVGGGTQA